MIPILLILLFSPSAQAETYRITGKATYADNTPVTLDYVYLQCIPGDFACYQYRGAQSITDAYGYYSILIDVTDEEDDLDILLNLRGENFTHTIDIQAHRDSTNSQMGSGHQTRTESTTIRRVPRFWLLHRLVHTCVCFRFDANRSSSINQTRSHGIHGYETSKNA